jgi:nitrile hydratase
MWKPEKASPKALETRMPAVHDLGGKDVHDPIDRGADDVNFFARRVTALVNLLRDSRRRAFQTDEFRRSIESLPPEQYLSLSYYEKWIQALRRLLVQKEILSDEEIEARVRQVAARLAAGRREAGGAPR